LVTLLGRDAERARIGALLDAARASRSGALVLRGEPGIGKTALLEDARAQASEMHLLSARGIEAESELPFASLHQLLRPALHLKSKLPGPQEIALKSALGLAERRGEDHFLVSAASLTLLSELAEDRPVLCVVDDAHWLDKPSTDALLFVARRLGAEGVAMLFAARDDEARRFEARELPQLELGELGSTAAASLLTSASSSAIDPGVRNVLVEQARGNALALLELPALLNEAQLAGLEPLPEPLPLSRDVEQIYLERVRRLPERTQRALLVAAADDEGDAGLILQAAGFLGLGSDALDAAEQKALVAIHDRQFDFRHPLVRSAVYGAATSSERRDAHRALATALANDATRADRRVWHLAAASLEPDEDVAQALEEAAQRAANRRGHAAEAKALARAAALSLNGTARARRVVRAARAARIACADDYAIALARDAQSEELDALQRAEIACVFAAADVRRGRPFDSFARVLESADEIAELDVEKAVELLIWANASATTAGQFAALADVSRAATRVLHVAKDGVVLHVLEALAAFPRPMHGNEAAELDDAFAWASTANDPRHVYVVAYALALTGDANRFDALVDRAISLSRMTGDLGVLAEALTARASVHSVWQRFDLAEREAEEGRAFARDLGATNTAAQCASVLAKMAAVRGDEAEARRYADEVIETASSHGLMPRVGVARYALAFLDLGYSRWAAALERLHALVDPQRSPDPVLAKIALLDTIEAATRAGEMRSAQEALEAFEDWSPSAPPFAQPMLHCGRALVHEQRAAEHFEAALELATLARPFDLARIRLLYGEHLRRERRRKDARALLGSALEAFEEMNADPWAERARSELRASGAVARKRDPSTLGQLTAQELQIVRFVSEGLSNKEIAAQLYLSPRTIDYHLRNVFAKLGITSRTQLVRLQIDDDERAGAPRVHAHA
jgi:DNA-binding CsgD family transcriptional regulator